MLEILWMLVFVVGAFEILAWWQLLRSLRALIKWTRELVASMQQAVQLIREQADAEEAITTGFQERLEALCHRMEL